jgi:hypothetical protein
MEEQVIVVQGEFSYANVTFSLDNETIKVTVSTEDAIVSQELTRQQILGLKKLFAKPTHPVYYSPYTVMEARELAQAKKCAYGCLSAFVENNHDIMWHVGSKEELLSIGIAEEAIIYPEMTFLTTE